MNGNLHRACSLLAALLAAGSLTAAEPGGLVGADGTLYQVHSGPYGELVPGGKEADADAPVLVLEVRTPGQPLARVPVAGTLGPETETPAAMVFEDRSETLYLVWESQRESGAALNFAGYAEESWSEVIDVASEGEPLRGSLRLLVTRDDYAAGGKFPVAVERTVLHLAWWDGGNVLPERVLYAPLVLLDGAYLGWHPVVTLNDLDPRDGSVGDPSLPGTFDRAPTVEQGADASTAILGFANPASGRLLTFEARVLPGELDPLAADLGSFILERGATIDPTDVEGLAAEVGAELERKSTAFHPAARSYLGEELRKELIDFAYDAGPPGVVLESLADFARGQIVDFGSTTFGTDLRNRLFDPNRLEVLRIASEPPDPKGEASSAPGHLIRLYLVSDRPLPESTGEQSRVYVSESGENSVVSWQGQGLVSYRESQGAGWSAVKTLPLSSGLGPEDAEAILRERVRDR